MKICPLSAMKHVKANANTQFLFSPQSLNVSASDSDSQAALVLQLLIISLIMLLLFFFPDWRSHLESTSCFLSYTVFDPQVCFSISEQYMESEKVQWVSVVFGLHIPSSALDHVTGDLMFYFIFWLSPCSLCLCSWDSPPFYSLPSGFSLFNCRNFPGHLAGLGELKGNSREEEAGGSGNALGAKGGERIIRWG